MKSIIQKLPQSQQALQALSSEKKSQQLLLRSFIHDRLYGEAEPKRGLSGGYFTKQEHQVGKLKAPIEFSKLRGYAAFHTEMERLYPGNAWVTPSELFKPYFSYTVANCMLNQMENQNQRKLRVLEIGPGTGSFADSLLDFMKNYNLELYRNCEYTFVEISPVLAATCELQMREQHRQLYDKGQIKIFNGSILDLQSKVKDFCFVVGMEILDNMPHDRLYTESHQVEGGDPELFNYVSTVLTSYKGKEEQLEERIVKLSERPDPLISLFLKLMKTMPELDSVQAQKRLNSEGTVKRMIDLFRDLTRKQKKETLQNNIFAPTVTLQLFQNIKRIVPNHSLIMADFDSFIMPKECVQGTNAPLVSEKIEGAAHQDTYLIPRGHADIYFPSDFFFLQHAYQEICGKPAQVYKNSEFMEQFSLESWAQTQNLYNPMREEYINTSFLVTDL